MTFDPLVEHLVFAPGAPKAFVLSRSAQCVAVAHISLVNVVS